MKRDRVKEKVLTDALEKGLKQEILPQRSMPPLDIGGATTLDELSIDLLCNALIDGYSLRNVAVEMDRLYVEKHGKPRMWGGRPSRMHATSILRWIEGSQDRIQMYESSRAAQADAYFSELLQISNEPVPLTIFGGYDTGAVNDKRLRIDTLKFITGRLHPKRYGDRLDLTSDGEKLPEMSPAQVEARLIALLAKAKPETLQLEVVDVEAREVKSD